MCLIVTSGITKYEMISSGIARALICCILWENVNSIQPWGIVHITFYLSRKDSTFRNVMYQRLLHEALLSAICLYRRRRIYLVSALEFITCYCRQGFIVISAKSVASNHEHGLPSTPSTNSLFVLTMASKTSKIQKTIARQQERYNPLPTSPP